MQLLDPIPESRITLEKAANHSWLRSPGKSLLRCGITAGRIASEVNQNIVMHMADHMGLSMKDVVNSVTRNRLVQLCSRLITFHRKIRSLHINIFI